MKRFAMMVVSSLVACILAPAVAAWAAEKPADTPAPPPAFVGQIKVLADKAPDCSSLASIVESVTRGCKTNDERAVAVYNFMLLACYHRAYPSEPGGVGALKVINTYGWSLCGGLHTVESALWRQLGWKWRYVGWPGHTTAEAQYDGRWHYLDTFLKYYTWMPDAAAPGGRTIAGEDDIKANPALVTDGLVFDKARKVYYHKGNVFEVVGGKANWTAPAFLVCGDEPDGIVQGTSRKNNAGSPTGWAGIKFDDPAYSADVNLGPGYALTLLWNPIEGAHWFNGRKDVPTHTCGDKDYRNSPEIGPIMEPYAAQNRARSFSSGTLVFAPDFSGDACLGSLAARENVKVDAGRLVPADGGKPASVTVLMQSPYVMSRASGAAEGAEKAEISTDGGRTFAAIDLKDFSDAVGGKYHALVRLTFSQALKSLRLETIIQHNRGALPYLSPGRNTITVSAADAKALGDNRLVITYAWCPGSRGKSYEEVSQAGAEIARTHYAAWADKPCAVQKTFAAKDLPATFTIDVPTPKNRQPVFPRMVLLRREVLPSGAKPLPLPDGAVEPKMGPDEELKTLPNPLMTGIGKPGA